MRFREELCKARKKHFPNDLTHPAFINTKKVIVMDTRGNPQTIAVTNFAFAGALKANTNYLMTENKQMEKDLEDAKQKIEQLQAETQKLSSTRVLEGASCGYIW